MTDPTDSAPTAGEGRTNVWAAISLIGVLVPILGIVAGHIALRQTRDGRQGGRELAIAGIVIGYVGIVMMVVGTALWLLAALMLVGGLGEFFNGYYFG